MKELLNHFDLKGEITSIDPFGNGHINKTYLVKTTEDSYVFQFINDGVFPDVGMLMENIRLVTDHLKKKGVKTLEIVMTKSDGLFLPCEDGAFFRGYRYIENSVCYEKLPTLEMVTEAARGFGAFHRDLADFDGKRLGEVIPGFHDTKKRYAYFLSLVKEDAKGRLASCAEDVAFLRSLEGEYGKIVDALNEGRIHNSVTHNDPKINNVAFDKTTGKVSCILDLDTVMGGSFLFDFGDGLRSLFTKDNEDNPDVSDLKVDFPVYRAYLEGYASMMKGVMNDEEVALLPRSILIIAAELAMRFLGDYIAGDVYFHADYPTHNLVRARSQIALAKDLLEHMGELEALTAEILR